MKRVEFYTRTVRTSDYRSRGPLFFSAHWHVDPIDYIENTRENVVRRRYYWDGLNTCTSKHSVFYLCIGKLCPVPATKKKHKYVYSTNNRAVFQCDNMRVASFRYVPHRPQPVWEKKRKTVRLFKTVPSMDPIAHFHLIKTPDDPFFSDMEHYTREVRWYVAVLIYPWTYGSTQVLIRLNFNLAPKIK